MVQQEIFYGDRKFVFASDSPFVVMGPNVLAIGALATPSLAKVWEIFVSNAQVKGLYVCGGSETPMQEVLLDGYTRVNAAGGVVESAGGKLLMIHRRGVGDLPKGKQESGESDESTALREVREETGVETLAITTKLCDTYHVYMQGEESFLKRTAWYAMSAGSEQALKPQAEEEIDSAVWLTKDEAWEKSQTTFPLIRRVLESYRENRG